MWRSFYEWLKQNGQFLALPQVEDVSDFHCVTTWSQFDMEFAGVAFFSIADLVKGQSPVDAIDAFNELPVGTHHMLRLVAPAIKPRAANFFW